MPLTLIIVHSSKNNTFKSPYCKLLQSERDNLSLEDNLVLLHSRRIVLPERALAKVLDLLHVNHSGITKTIALAKGLYYWPGMVRYITWLINSCKECSLLLPSQIPNPSVTKFPSTHLGYPVQHIGLDLFSHLGHTYLICVDHWSGYPMYKWLTSVSTASVVRSGCTSWFDILGWSKSIRLDGGPQFTNIFDIFCTSKNIIPELSANPKSNGLAESPVKNVNNILRKCALNGEDPDTVLYDWTMFPAKTAIAQLGYFQSLPMYWLTNNLQTKQSN